MPWAAGPTSAKSATAAIAQIVWRREWRLVARAHAVPPRPAACGGMVAALLIHMLRWSALLMLLCSTTALAAPEGTATLPETPAAEPDLPEACRPLAKLAESPAKSQALSAKISLA